jgi:lipid-A-disaccharide synthase
VWRQGRLKHIRNFIDITICLFNFEHEFYQKENLKSIHLGHPFSHLEKGNKQAIYNKYNLAADKHYVSILPGSRKSEINNLLPTYIGFIKEHSEKYSDYEYLIPAVDNSSMKDIKNMVPPSLPVHVHKNCSNEFLSVSDYSIVTSGTATLEASVLSCNPIICYKTSFINYAIISRMLKIDNVGLPNLLLESRIFPELIQSDCNKQNLMKEAEKMQQGFCFDDYALKLQNLLLGEGFQETAKTIRRL